MKPPTPQQIQTVRAAAVCSLAEAADMVHVTKRAWQFWESGERQMPVASWELLLIKLGLHPVYDQRMDGAPSRRRQ